jgi:hypothetical protein
MKYKRNATIVFIKPLFVAVLLLVSSSTFLAGGENANNKTITKTYIFQSPELSQVLMDGIVYDTISFNGCTSYGQLGEPLIPARGVYLLLPQGSEVVDIEVLFGEEITVGTGFTLMPFQEPVSFSNGAYHKTSPSVKNELIYAKNSVFPSTAWSSIGTYSFRGYNILVLNLFPVKYIPKIGKLSYFKDMTVSIHTVETENQHPLFRNLEADEIAVAKKVENPSTISTYTDTQQPLSSDEYDLLILTTQAFKDDFSPLKTAHDEGGIPTEIKTLRDISLFPSTVTPDDIRDFIRKEYINKGIKYALIGGDYDVVPAQKLLVRAGGSTANMPSDLFYACLDGTYNYDEDDYYGEPGDGEDGGDVDLVGEVYVGRACVESEEEIDNFLEKTLAYLDSGGYTEGQVLMVGEYLWSDPDTFGGDYMDELINGSSANMYTTVGIPGDQYIIDSLYDRDWPGQDWPKSEIKSRINNGALLINHLGHSSYGYNMKMVNDDIPSLTNDNPCFIYSQGCMAGGFDNPDGYDCIAEYFTVKTENAAFAVIMNARYGWGVVGSTDGPSQRYHREFWDAVFGEHILEIGKANQDSKEDNLHRITGSCMRWCYYQLNLFGDPALSFFISDNHPPEKPARPSGLQAGKVGNEHHYDSTSEDCDGDILYYKWDFGDGTFSEWLGPYSSNEEVQVSHIWTKIGRYLVKVKVRDEHRAESDWSDPLPVRMPVLPTFPFLQVLIQLLQNLFPQLSVFMETWLP